jgi:hypothetical protein
MFGSESSRRHALAMTIAWWYLRRLIRKRGTAAVAGLVAGQGLSFASKSRKRRPFRWILVLGIAVAGGLIWWRRQRGGGDDWGDWTPVVPDAPPPPAQPVPTPEPALEPVAT